MTMTYSVTDSSAQAGKAYYYKLEDISYTGTVSMVGPVVLDAGISAAQVASTTGTPKAAPRTTSTASSGAIARSVSSGSVAAGSATIATAVTPTVLFPNVAAAPSVQPAAAGFGTPTSVALQASPPASVPAQTPAAPSRLSQAPLYGNAAAGTIANSAEPPLPANDRPLRFSVAITDARGNMITVSREEALAGPSEVTPVKVEQGKQVVVSWTVRHLAARGFALLRRVKGNKEYETVVTYIPNFALDASGTYRYRIIDATAKPGTQYEYLRTAQDWGVQVGAATPPK